MKKYIKANRYATKADKTLQHLRMLSQALVDVIDCTDENKISDIVGDAIRIPAEFTKEEGISALLKNIDYIGDEYIKQRTQSQSYPKVKQTLIDFLKDLGYAMIPIKGKHWGQEAFVIISADKCEFENLNIVCKQISDEFGNRWDTPLSGSWTGHSSQIDGVDFHVSFERDYDYDPSGKEMSLQLYF